jgi:hypothetical protein
MGIKGLPQERLVEICRRYHVQQLALSGRTVSLSQEIGVH